MSDTELQKSQETDQSGVNSSEQQIESKIGKEIEKLKYYLEQTDELIEDDDWREIETVNKLTKAILDEIYNESEIPEEKLQAELKLTEKKLEMEKAARTTPAKLPKLKISPFNGTAADWVGLENMFVTQVDTKSISDEEKFGYLLEMSMGKNVS